MTGTGFGNTLQAGTMAMFYRERRLREVQLKERTKKVGVAERCCVFSWKWYLSQSR